MLSPAQWPETPGFESEPLRWRSPTPHLLGYEAAYRDEFLTLALAEDSRPLAEGIFDLLAAISELRSRGSGPALGPVVASIGRRVERVVAARLGKDAIELYASGATLPFLFRSGRPCPFESERDGDLRRARVPLTPGDLVLIPSEGLVSVLGDRTGELESHLQRAAKLAATGTIAGTFTDLVARWKAEGKSPGTQDLLLLGARKL
jgi:hypothetical protein